MPDKQQKRQIAKKVRIKDILNSNFVKQEGWQPNYVQTTNNRKISRVNIIGVVVSEEKNQEMKYSSVTIDDSTGKIPLRVFQDDAHKLNNVSIGDMVLIIGRPKEYGGEKYILLEIIKKIKNKKWADVRKQELDKIEKQLPEPQQQNTEPKKENSEPVEEKIEATAEKTPVEDKIIEFVRKKDQGEGVEMDIIVKEFDNEKKINTLLNEGELFEVKPGKVKVLE